MSCDKSCPYELYSLDFKFSKELMLGTVCTSVSNVVSPLLATLVSEKPVHAGEMPYEWRQCGQSSSSICFKHMKELTVQKAVNVSSVLEPSGGDAGSFGNMRDILLEEKPMMFRCHCSHRFRE